eukprot:CAMPEP_0198536418 /NCGR_PEP_ID=MMETSP1462-20131121/41840_1 /TAXON_ID=1333877 /ORGANISM="Brandtodinium nutriculum, Strain RCC3387" /LENGTH=60 /DNA_ID=CAMNT_0044266373 /DNA_START=1 /DNA_END=183 /DNA_ORIENTATION=-
MSKPNRTEPTAENTDIAATRTTLSQGICAGVFPPAAPAPAGAPEAPASLRLAIPGVPSSG